MFSKVSNTRFSDEKIGISIIGHDLELGLDIILGYCGITKQTKVSIDSMRRLLRVTRLFQPRKNERKTRTIHLL